MTTRPLPHRAWAWLALVLGVLARLWALPFTLLGWLVGVVVLTWGNSLKEAHERRSRPQPTKVRASIDQTDADGFDDDYEDSVDED